MSVLVKRVAFLAFPGMTSLDLVGAYDALRRIAPMQIDPEVTCRVVGTKQTIVDETGLTIVADGNVVTAAGVTSALDLGLYLVDWLWGEDARERIATVMEYRAYQPA